MRTDLIQDYDQLLALSSGWDELAGGLPFRGSTWLHVWWKHYGLKNPRRALYTLAVRDDSGQLVGIAPWYVEQTRIRGSLLKFLGDDEICTDYLGIFVAPGQEPQVTGEIARFLTGECPDNSKGPRWDIIELDTATANDGPTIALWRELAGSGLATEIAPGRNNWRLTFPPSWDEYMEVLSRDWRKKFRKLNRKWLETGLVKRYVATPESLDRAWGILSDLHQKRRRSMGDDGLFASTRFVGFHREVIERLLPRGEICLHWIEVEDHPIAIEYSLYFDGVHYAYQSGINPDYLEYDPGTTLFIAYVKDALRSGERAYDCMRGDEPYKAHWRAQPTETQVFRAVAPHASARWRQTCWRLGKRAKGLIKKGLVAAGVR